MKTILFTLFLFVSTLDLYAQNINELKTSMSLGNQNAFFVEIIGADRKMCIKTYENMTKSYGKSKENKKAKEFNLVQTRLAAINGSSLVDVYLKFEQGREQTTAYMWVDMGTDFVNSENHPNQALVIKQFLNDFYVDARKQVVTEEIKVEEKKLADLEKDLRKLKEKKDDYQAEIEKCKQKIAEAENNIVKNSSAQTDKMKEIDIQKGDVKKVIDKLNSIGKKVE